MKHIIHELKIIDINYPVDWVTCYQKAFAICLNKFNPEYAQLFYIMTSASKCYEFSCFKSMNFQQIQSKIINDIFEVTFENKLVINKFHNEIQKNIDMNNPVVVSGNLRELFYSKHYKEDDWSHPFIIKGYNLEKRLYYIIDDTHLTSEESQDFSIRFEDLEIAHNSFIKNISKDNSFYVFLNKSTINKTSHEILKDILDFYFDDDYKYKEIQLIEKLCNKSKVINENVFFNPYYLLINMPKYKNVFFIELINALKNHVEINEEQYQDLLCKKESLLKNWKIFINSFLKNYNKNQDSPVVGKTYIDLLIREEKELHKAIFKIVNLEQKENIKSTIFKYSTENGKEIIKAHDKIFNFSFNGKKLYNTWFFDESPKVMFSPEDINKELEIELTVKNNFQSASFLAGIVISTVNKSVFFFGMDGEERINLDQGGSIESFKEILGCFKQIQLCSKLIRENKIEFYYKFSNEQEYSFFYSLQTDEKIESVGFGCKTYNIPKLLEVEFKVI